MDAKKLQNEQDLNPKVLENRGMLVLLSDLTFWVLLFKTPIDELVVKYSCIAQVYDCRSGECLA